jgi:hypothetical protein
MLAQKKNKITKARPPSLFRRGNEGEAQVQQILPELTNGELNDEE